MKKVFLLIGLAAVASACNRPDTTTSTTETTNPPTAEPTQAFGAAFSEAPVVPAARLQEMAAGKDSVQATVEGEIIASCQAKGCWMDVKLAENSIMKVTFRDYGFFMPVEDLKGRKVVFTGIAKREVISVDDQRHYAKDAGKSETEIASITSPKEELRFVADGVILK
ncbi:uncharacterized protein DUF4920 [Pontibacter ummariensis]|uniref:DUF4920 domain-containing protein n=1 Tax=Pontibacter ummariensis TaxID=1610492 RepID=A0A239F951_9BACT|nr:DUF4920 domain-containing protein [Pontibacter ummariensis]PRY12368.1 uncharacterized protein DUF4920 [Pontibacter ummariensis]SNS53335.1 protein of unknown function [Pontibacter ummariensis]